MALAGYPPFFFFNDTATTEIYTLSLHDALPISKSYSDMILRMPDVGLVARSGLNVSILAGNVQVMIDTFKPDRSEEHTSELQSPDHLVCRLLLEKKNNSTDTAIGQMTL